MLNTSPYPDDFPQHWRLAYVPESQQLVIEYDLPGIDVVPTIKTYRYVKATGTINETSRPATQIKAQYASVVAQTALRVVDDVFEADRLGHIESIVLNGMVSTNDPATGRSIRPCLITLRTTRATFGELDLRRVDPAACLRQLGAGVSRSPAELTPVRPILEFDMVDPRFVEETDIISGLDQRANLMDMTPTEFEGLIQNLFARMGLETRQTRASRDGGVDCVAFDNRPIVGGKVVIQAKRYKNTVGVSAVRDLFGTLQNEGASKGILVTTSGYGQASFDFAAGKPLELLDGANLLFLLQEHAGIEARIEVPQNWRDTAPDSPPLADETSSPTNAPEQLSPGQNVPLDGDDVTLTIGWQSGPYDLDGSALLLGTDGKVRSDSDFIFFNQPTSPDGAVTRTGKTLTGNSHSDALQLQLSRLDTSVDRIIIAISIDGARFANANGLRVTATTSSGRSYTFTPAATVETALICAEIYQRSSQWRLRAVGLRIRRRTRRTRPRLRR